MSEIATEFEFPEIEERPQGKGPNSEVWKWIATALFSCVMFVAGYAVHGGITRAECQAMLNGPENPYVAERGGLKMQLEQLSEQQKSISDQLMRLSIALGVQPDGTVVRRSSK